MPNISWIEITQGLAAMSNVVTHPNAPSKATLAEAPKPKLLDEVHARIRRLNYSIRTEDTYVDWVRRFVLFHSKRHPRDMGARAVLNSVCANRLASVAGRAASKSDAVTGVRWSRLLQRMRGWRGRC